MKKLIISIITITLGILMSIPSAIAVDKQELTISAAASLTDALKEVATLFEAQHPDTKLYFNFAASGVLARQIEQGAPVDVFISAATKQVDQLDNKGLLLSGSRRNILSNDVVLIVQANSKIYITSFDDLKKAEVKSIAIGNPDFVPIGQYSKEVFKSMKLIDAVAYKTIYGEDVRQVLSYVARGEVDAGLVFTTDAMMVSDKVKIIATAPSDSHKPIVYPVAVVKSSKNPALSKEFVNFLSGNEAQAVFKKYGFKGI